jgi:hypothetical protein
MRAFCSVVIGLDRRLARLLTDMDRLWTSKDAGWPLAVADWHDVGASYIKKSCSKIGYRSCARF